MEQNLKKYYIIGYGFLAAVLVFLALKKSGATPIAPVNQIDKLKIKYKGKI